MNKRVKKLWIKALTSGEYEQGTDGLRAADKFCCLGVLCDLYSKETGEPWDTWESIHGADSYLPDEVKVWAGMSEEVVTRVGDVKLPEDFPVGLNSLAKQNDKGTPFPEIAKLIEQNL